MDADDWLERYALELLYYTAKRYNAQIIAYGLWPSKEPGRSGRWVFRCTPDRDVLYCGNGMEALFYEHGSRPFVINKFFHIEFLRKNELFFEESLDIGEDQFFQFVAFRHASTICFIRERLYHYEMGRSDSAMNRCKKQRNLQEKNFYLLQKIMKWKDEQRDSQCDKGYVWWILSDYAWAVNQKNPQVMSERRKQIFTIQMWLKGLSAEEHIEGLPDGFQEIFRRFIDYIGEPETGVYLQLPYEEFDACMTGETTGLCEPVILPSSKRVWSRRIYEIAVFHEVGHLVMEILIWIAKKYRKLCAGKTIWQNRNDIKFPS